MPRAAQGSILNGAFDALGKWSVNPVRCRPSRAISEARRHVPAVDVDEQTFFAKRRFSSASRQVAKVNGSLESEAAQEEGVGEIGVSVDFDQECVAETVVQRVARAIWTEWTSLRISLGDKLPDVDYEDGADKPSAEFIARMAIEAMRDPPSAVVMAVEAKAEERYGSGPGMTRWYGDDVWNAGVDAALKGFRPEAGQAEAPVRRRRP